VDVRSDGLPQAPPVDVAVAEPYRLDLTVAILRRTQASAVDAFADGTYVRLLAGGPRPKGFRARQRSPERLAIEPFGDGVDAERVVAIARRMLGTAHDPARFRRAAAGLPWLGPLAERMRGARGPRYPTLWEAIVNAVVFQAVSLAAASAILLRAIVALEPAVALDRTELRPFPSAERWLEGSDSELRLAGLSGAKITTLRRAAGMLVAGDLTEAELDALDTEAAAARLQRLPGIGPWTAAVILLRGFGRLDTFPGNDSGAARALAMLGVSPSELPAALAALGDERGMLYFHLLLARLERLPVILGG